MTDHDCTGDVDTCRVCAHRRDRIEDEHGVFGQRELDFMADAAAAREYGGRD